jgi:hypothetical protein
MNVHEALGALAEIHEQLAKGEIYRGYHPTATAASGLCGLIATAVQPWVIAAHDSRGFLVYWLGTAIFCALVSSSVTIVRYLTVESESDRRRTRQVVGQFGPSLAAGAMLGLAWRKVDAPVELLPGLWAMLFSLGIFSSRPYLPRAAGWVGLGYLSAGSAWLLWPPADLSAAGQAIGVTFGAGQAAAALVLWRNQEREHG